MNRRAALAFLIGATGAAVASSTAAFTLRLHSKPRRTPFLTTDHLEGVNLEDIPEPRVLFIGNSMILRYDVAAITAKFAAEDGISLSVATAAADGARLIETIRIPELERLLEDGAWSAVVLQDFTKTPLRRTDRWGSRYAMSWFRAQLPRTPIVLYPPWPAMADNKVYEDAGFLTYTPRDPADFRKRTMGFYGGVATDFGFHLSEVPAAWAKATAEGQDLYAPDGHHANELGAKLSAKVLWSVLKGLI